MSVAEMDSCDEDLTHYATEEELDLRTFGMGPPGTTGVCIDRQDTGAGRPRDSQQPPPGAHAGEAVGNANAPTSAAMDEDSHRSAAADTGPDAQALPAASSGAADTAEEAPCTQDTHQGEAEACAVLATGGTGRTNGWGRGTTCITECPPAVLHEERAEGTAGSAHPPEPAAEEECVHPGAATSTARVGMQKGPPPGAPETEDILASIFDEVTSLADQGLQTDKHLHDDESFAAFMASCRDEPPTRGPTTTSALQHTAQNREPTSTVQNPASVSHQAHLRRNYTTLGPVAAAHATTAAVMQEDSQWR